MHGLSTMFTGITLGEIPNLITVEYEDVEGAKQHLLRFLGKGTDL